MTTPAKALSVLDSVAESLDKRRSKLATDADAISYAIQRTHRRSQVEVANEILDEVADALESRGAYRLAAAADRIAEAAQPKYKFKVGDEVKLTAKFLQNTGQHFPTHGRKGVVTKIKSSGFPVVKWEDGSERPVNPVNIMPYKKPDYTGM